MLLLDHYGHEQRQRGECYWLGIRRRQPRGAWLLQQVLKGRLLIRDDDQEHQLGPGDCFLLRFGSKAHYGWPDRIPQNLEVRWVLLRGSELDLLLADLPTVFQPPADTMQACFDRLVRHASRERVADPKQAAVTIYGVLLELLERCGEQAATATSDEASAVADALRRLIANPLHPWNLAQLARECGCSRDHLCRVFKKRYHARPLQWLQSQRLQAAEELLRHSDMRVQAIAEQCGFGSSQSLARLLRSKHGCGPRTWRSRP